jgi:hypothetical protein
MPKRLKFKSCKYKMLQYASAQDNKVRYTIFSHVHLQNEGNRILNTQPTKMRFLFIPMPFNLSATLQYNGT